MCRSNRKNCLSEKRKLVYDFFRIELPQIDYRINGANSRDKLYSQIVCYTTREGALDYFIFRGKKPRGVLKEHEKNVKKLYKLILNTFSFYFSALSII